MKKKNYFTTVILYIVVGAFVFAFMFIFYRAVDNVELPRCFGGK